MQVGRDIHPASTEASQRLRQQELLAKGIGLGKGDQQIDITIRALLPARDAAEEIRLDDAMGPHDRQKVVRNDIRADSRSGAAESRLLHGRDILPL